VRAATRTADGTWSPAQQLSGAGEASGPAVGVDPQGRITAVWSEGDKIMWAGKAPGSGWTGAQQTTITLYRATSGRAHSAAFRRVGSVKAKLRAGANTIHVKRIKNKRLARGRYRATIAVAGLTPLQMAFKITR
jgi:hypothetical protein